MNQPSESIDIGFLRRMGYEFNEDETECRVLPRNDNYDVWHPVQEVIDDYVDFWQGEQKKA